MSEDRVREVIHNFNSDGFDSLVPKYSGGRPAKFTLPERRETSRRSCWHDRLITVVLDLVTQQTG